VNTIVLEYILKIKHLFIPVLALLVGCHVPADRAMDGAGGRTSYNNVLQRTSKEQMLLNIVRLRYFDVPYFLDVGNVTTQFTYKTTVAPSFTIPGFSEKNPAKIAGEVQWQNQPTIQYAPVQGQAYVHQLLQPVGLRHIQELLYSGWSIERVFRLIVQGFDGLLNAPEASGPLHTDAKSYDEFAEAVKLLRKFQEMGELQIGVDLAAQDEDDEKKMAHQLQLAFPAEGKDAQRLNELLYGLKMRGKRYYLTLKLGFDKTGRIGVLPRSVLSSIYFLSQGVEVPAGDKCIKEIKYCNGGDQLITVRNCTHCPTNAFAAVKYRDRWYYIHEQDMESKKTFVLLQQLYNLKGDISTQPPPLLTLPLGLG